jgi:hypothetical protein
MRQLAAFEMRAVTVLGSAAALGARTFALILIATTAVLLTIILTVYGLFVRS